MNISPRRALREPLDEAGADAMYAMEKALNDFLSNFGVTFPSASHYTESPLYQLHLGGSPDSHACLEVGLHGKGKLIDEDLLESRDVVLLVEDEHGLLVVH